MGLKAALRWWEEWQLRVLVLSSLFVQGILFFSVFVRQFHALRRLRAVVWIAYIGSDALAIYALATLFNRHKELPSVSVGRGSSSLEIIWAPVLLIHLGGQLVISAYSLEDNELWRRHVITLVCQVTVALYVFCRWWSGDERQLTAAVLLFIVGIIRFSWKPWALWNASFNYMLAAADVSSRGAVEERNLSLEQYVQEANKCEHDTETTPGANRDLFISSMDYIAKMFADMSSPYSVRLKGLRLFLKLDGVQAHTFSAGMLRGVFRILYSSGIIPKCRLGLVGSFKWLSITALVLASLILFAKSHKDGYRKADVTVTYILFGSNVVQQLAPLSVNGLLWIIEKSGASEALERTNCFSSDMVSQCNLMSFSIRKNNPTILMKLAAPFNRRLSDRLRDYINKHCYIEQVPAGRQITALVKRHVKNGWKSYIIDAAAYKRFNNHRGQGTLRRHQHYELEWSLKMPFDESVLLWHIATDLCFHYKSEVYCREEFAERSRWISNYMAYLLLICPEMLMPGTRSSLFNVASDEIEHILRGSTATLDKEEMLAQKLMDTAEKSSTTAMAAEENYTATLILAACRVAKALMNLEERKRWTLIEGVWTEMLCYSASRCRGYLHAKSLGEGVEYLTVVWFLWSYMGMDTFTYMLQSSELPEEEEEGGGGGGASTSQSQDYRADQSADVCPV